MQTAEILDDDLPIKPRFYGLIIDESGETDTLYAVFRLADVERVVGKLEEQETDRLAAQLTGWTSFYRGPGRSFANKPVVTVRGKWLMVKQFRGLDI